MEIFKIEKNLYQSTYIDADGVNALKKNKIEIVIDLEDQFDFHEIAKILKGYIFWPIIDGKELPDLKMLDGVADFGYRMLKDGRRVLTHCTEGVNRASLINCMILYKYKGLKGKDLVSYIQGRRQGALTNETFKKYIFSLK